jgi:hypothetical protein
MPGTFDLGFCRADVSSAHENIVNNRPEVRPEEERIAMKGEADCERRTGDFGTGARFQGEAEKRGDLRTAGRV